MRLYQFIGRDHGVNNIALRRLKVSIIEDLNDPFELMPFRFSTPEQRTGFENAKRDLAKDHGVLCFSKHWGNPVLWSHYAEKHRGMCLGFDIPEEMIIEVEYMNDRILFDDADETAATKLLTVKFKHWEYEEERRLYVTLSEEIREGGLFFHPFDEKLILREVILGPRCSLSVERARDLVSGFQPEVVVTRSELDGHQFRVIPAT